ncbi:ComGF family competence protein [Gracilibacillus massiliensis]|uniref:ComGF family competence protein n=1 Tax=Gracilibacillus massiliensis TaxID=1564956 RepID=UPI00071D0A3A|nr:ComGF family competence protein [Gracilibacillus massiliensis]
MLEALVSILLLMILLSWLSQSDLLWKQSDDEELPMFTQFHHIIELEAQLSKQVDVENNQLYFLQNNGDIVVISLHKHKIRRQVNQRGHEELVRNIQEFRVAENEDDIKIYILTDSGEQIEKTLLKKME